ncbi:hypothetical protein N483_20625 [Pseudoalteromonas luteoviolacea NCIMB 1944]|nr:hypothetical protein N483_20625 [Pseudoalteromonas luteoviolacea NCIMB 1944]
MLPIHSLMGNILSIYKDRHTFFNQLQSNNTTISYSFKRSIMSVTIYHNPRCSKSRQTLALLEENDIQPEIVEYLKTPIDESTLDTLISKLGFDSAHQLVRNKETIYKELGLSKDSDEQTLRNAMLENPKLIERPIVVKGEKAALGRPPESVLDII